MNPTSPPATPLPNRHCPLCGGPNHCLPAQSGQFCDDCWCSKARISAEALAQIPAEQRNQACLCPRCAGVVTDNPAS